MNKIRRAQLSALHADVDSLVQKVQLDLDQKEVPDRANKLEFAALADDIQGLREQCESIKDEEQEYYYNMPSGLQGGEKGDNAQSVVSELDDADNAFHEAHSAAESEDHETVIAQLDLAKDAIDNAGSY
jgi:hypothetical protein